jgi:hypothetical protein
MVSVLNDSLDHKMPPKAKKAAPAPFPQGKAGASKKAPKVRKKLHLRYHIQHCPVRIATR